MTVVNITESVIVTKSITQKEWSWDLTDKISQSITKLESIEIDENLGVALEDAIGRLQELMNKADCTRQNTYARSAVL